MAVIKEKWPKWIQIFLKLGDTRFNATLFFLLSVHELKSGPIKIGFQHKILFKLDKMGVLGRGGYIGAFGQWVHHQLGVASTAAFPPIKQLHGIRIVQFLLSIASDSIWRSAIHVYPARIPLNRSTPGTRVGLSILWASLSFSCPKGGGGRGEVDASEQTLPPRGTHTWVHHLLFCLPPHLTSRYWKYVQGIDLNEYTDTFLPGSLIKISMSATYIYACLKWINYLKIFV